MFKSPVLEQNRELANQIDQEVRANPEHPYTAKFIGLANGKVVTVADNLDDVCLSLEQIEPDNTKTYVLETNANYSDVEEIWESL